MSKINILLTSAGSAGHGSSIGKALMVSNLDLNIIGADMSPRMLMVSPFEEKVVIPSASDDTYIDKLKEIIKKYSIDCIFTGSEQELIKVSTCREEIESTGVKVFINNSETIQLCKNKLRCSSVLEKLGFNPPKTIRISSIEDAEAVDFFPAVVKPYLETGASVNIFVAEKMNDLKFFSRYLLDRGIAIIAQEYIPYENNEFTVGVTTLLDEPKVVGSIALRKFMEGMTRFYCSGDIVISSGVTQGEFLDFFEVKLICEQIAEKLGSTGPLNIQLRLVDGKVRPFEINPRFSGTTSARAFNGYNEPEFFIRKYLLGDKTAQESISTNNKGYVVKGLAEKYVSLNA